MKSWKLVEGMKNIEGGANVVSKIIAAEHCRDWDHGLEHIRAREDSVPLIRVLGFVDKDTRVLGDTPTLSAAMELVNVGRIT